MEPNQSLFIGAFTNLKYLNFSGSLLIGIIPPELGNLTKLDILDLSSVYHSLSTNSFTWLSRLSNLRILKLNSCFTKAIDWFDSFRTAPSLLNLHLLHECEFPELDYDSTFSHTTTNSSTNSITTLEVVSRSSFGSTTVSRLLNLSNNLIDLSLFLDNDDHIKDHIIPHTLGSLKSLRHLHLSGFVGEVPKFIGNLCKLQELVLNYNTFNSSTITDIFKSLIDCNSNSLEILNLPHNNLTGQFVPIDIARIPNLKELDVSYNKFNGKWPESISKLPSLELLYISGNSFSGVVYETHLHKLSKLEHLDLSYNSLTLKFGNNWVPSIQLQHLGLRSCMIGPHFPSWLQTQSNISHIDLSYSGISDTIPTWSFNTISSLNGQP
ncbi:receptor-like protein EIX1 [Cannabis sativa]|uniref:receptor-like protein EIX1 n=1 Tax=Cannabis sativa TaxID=3483 RepID=UPI0029C9CB99|nr:receptor-like protein EIX1 [Cannabis sativa]